MKKNLALGDSDGKLNRKINLAVVVAIFGILLFIALALTLPQGPSS